MIKTVDEFFVVLTRCKIDLKCGVGQQIRSTQGRLCPICAIDRHRDPCGTEEEPCRADSRKCLSSAGRIRLDPDIADRIARACDGSNWNISLRLRLINNA